ncbi:MAG: hypothetical protein P8X74_13475 [Reinekea sp.]
MDRHNWNFPNANYYNHEQYSQAYQEYGQHTSQPETGQTSGGVAASGSSWSYPALGQPQQPYPDFNFPQWIPPVLGSDLECLLPPPQPTPFENIIQNDVPPGSSDAQPAVKKQQRKSFVEFKEQFLADLDKYAQGYKLKDCSASIDFSSYATSTGRLQKDGWVLYDKLDQQDKNRVDQALKDRQVSHSLRPYSNNSTRTRILQGLEAYASGATLIACSATIRFDAFLSTDGHLLPRGQSLYNKLNQEDKDRVDQALKSRKENVDKVRTSFMEGLEAYANGAPLTDCSETLNFNSYVSARGYLHEQGTSLYNRLGQGDKNRIDDALSARQKIHFNRITTNDTPMDAFLGGLDAYASGAPLKDCSATIKFSSYATSDGRLLLPGKRLYKKLVGGAGEAMVNKALADRRRITAQHFSRDIPHFLAALVPYGNGLDLQVCGEASGVKVKLERYLNPEGGLTAKGELLVENLLRPDQQASVLSVIKKRRQFLETNAPAPESQWLWPETLSPMPELGGMNPTAMHDPMKTETMWATAWQLTGQAMPGPSASAAHPISDYNNEAFGADFQHPSWPLWADSTERTGPPYQPGNRGPYADQYPGRGA